MSPLQQTFGNASKRGWAVASLGINGWFGYVTTGETYGYGSGFDAVGGVYASLRDQTDGAVGLMMKFNSLGNLVLQKRANSGTVAPGGGASDGTDFYAGFGPYVIKFNESLIEQYSKQEGNQQYTVYQPNGNYMAVVAYNLNSNGTIIHLYNKNGTKVWSRISNGAINGWAGIASANGVVYAGTNAGSTPNIAVLNSAGTNTANISPVLSGETFSFGQIQAVDSSDNCVVCWNGTTGRFLVKYNSSGGIVWQRKITGTSINLKPIVGVDAAGNVYTAFNNATGNFSLFIMKYNSSGTLLWQRSITKATGNMGGSEVGTIGFSSDGNYLSIAGNGGGTSGSGNAYILKLATSGSGLGTYSVGGNNWTYAASSLTDAAASTTVSTGFGQTWSAYSSTQTAVSPGYTFTSFGATTKVF